jgi:riboflavin synthase
MFTGLIRELGTITALDDTGVTVRCPALRPELASGASVAVDGVCLTVAELVAEGFRADLLPETRQRTALQHARRGQRVNLEPALKVGEELGGHFVQGHVDGVVRLRSTTPGANDSRLLSFGLPEWLAPHITVHGSIALNGVSLTVQQFAAEQFSVALIPTTATETNLGNLKPGDAVNAEADMLIKAVRRSVEQLLGDGGLSEEKLRKWGY